MGFIANVKEGLRKRSAESAEIRKISRDAQLKEQKIQVVRVAREKVRIRAQADLSRERARASLQKQRDANSSRARFARSIEPRKAIAPRKIKKRLKKLKRKGVDRGVQAAIPRASAGIFNPITGEGGKFKF